MHDTAFHIGTLAMNIYADLRTDSILEVGSQALNGSLRESALPTTRYVGIDIEQGEGVDIVVEAGRPFPVNDADFDLVMATSVFEHDPCFWLTFLEMCRATRDGGYIYINAPSNGAVHRYPQDNWRFYPDSGRALAQWATSQGLPVILVESFIARREKDIWNDFVAVFRKGPIKKTLPNVFVHEHVPCTDVITWKSKEIQNSSEKPEDMLLLDRAEERARVAEGVVEDTRVELDSLVEELGRLKARLAETESERLSQQDDLNRLRSELSLRGSELAQRQEEIEQTRAEVAQKQKEIEHTRTEVAQKQKEIEDLARDLDDEKAERTKVSLRLQSSNEEVTRLSKELVSTEEQLDRLARKSADDLRNAEAVRINAQAEARAVETKLSERFQEIATLTQLLRQQEQHTVTAEEHVEWLMALHDKLTGRRPKWWSLMPEAWRRRREHERLEREGLFDARAYLRRYPDVEAAGLDPLDHYVRHGLQEGRTRAFHSFEG